MTRQILNIIFACLIASTFYHDYVVASRLKKKILLKGLVGAGLLVKYLKPKKGILPFPIPLPLPLPIEWEQPPIIVHSKHHHVPIPQPVPMPVHTPVHVPSRTPSCDLNPGSTFELKGELVSSPKHSSAKLYLHPCTKNILHLTNHIVMDPNSGDSSSL
ncbi:uncharacterized protein LOC107361605 isoform X2 [Tetranychus urticae]|uniref:uncharacterized protein LOC107361605 isoform X2 n=1 Tax=Tetranychus urticae TaxID=32264 RepID=UPI000D65BB50|nr:uncharacterized protein LOC107361605 isoform X2 [Tetranychus urticae]